MLEPRLIRSWPQFLPFGVLVEEYRLPPHFDMSPHTHEMGHGWLILDGGFEQESDDAVRWRSPGEIDAYGGGTIHRIHAGDRGCRCVVFEDVLPAPGPAAGSSIADALQRLLRGRADPSNMQDVLHALIARADEGALFRREPDWIRDVDALIAERFLRPLRAGDVARHVGMHRAHLVREYRQFRGRTIADQVKMLRLDWARNVLIRRALPLIELALEAGFADQSHFTREFALRYGTSPRRYLTAM